MCKNPYHPPLLQVLHVGWIGPERRRWFNVIVVVVAVVVVVVRQRFFTHQRVGRRTMIPQRFAFYLVVVGSIRGGRCRGRSR